VTWARLTKIISFAVGAVGAFIIGIARRKLSLDDILQSFLQATRTASESE